MINVISVKNSCKKKFVIGDIVKITKGHFQGLKAKVVKITKKETFIKIFNTKNSIKKGYMNETVAIKIFFIVLLVYTCSKILTADENIYFHIFASIVFIFLIWRND